MLDCYTTLINSEIMPMTPYHAMRNVLDKVRRYDAEVPREYFHLLHCNASREQPIGNPGCCCEDSVKRWMKQVPFESGGLP